MSALKVRPGEYNIPEMNRSPQIARVFVQLKTRSLDKPFDYRIPPALSGRVRAGTVVLVRLGNQKAVGIVSEKCAESEVPLSRLVDIEEVVDYPAMAEPLIRLAVWVSRYYYCSPAVAMSLAMPPGGLPALVKKEDDERCGYTLKRPSVKPRKLQFARLLKRGGKQKITETQQRIYEILDNEGDLPVVELCREAGVSRSPVNSMVKNGLAELYEREVRRESLRYYGGAPESRKKTALKLNREQQEALKAMVQRIDAPEASERSHPIMLMGVPGSGKTEVYLRAIEEVVKRGGSAIVLVPEISLTHQAVKRFYRRFGERVGILHSGLGDGERYDEYRRIRLGEVDVVIGPRSALFAPLDNLKLIIIDEENDSSFKQENEPRYDARRVALERARIEGACLLYGSATPSLESYHRVEDRFVLRKRATGALMPDVEIVDMRQEHEHVLSGKLTGELDAMLSTGGKAILLLNRRGYSSFLQCGDCGHVWQCQNCDISLTLHSTTGRLRCHHCGYFEAVPDICTECNSTGLRRWGVGTERLQRELQKRFPEAEIFRLDADTARDYGGGPRILERFGNSHKAILLGTQMVAKGHHFPDVTLAAVINADLSLQFPEFRAEEQTFALLQQLAGRSGRAQKPGKVLIQTWNADIGCIKMAAGLKTDDFYRGELERRRKLGYPPFKKLINIVCLSHDGGKPAKACAHLKEKLGQVLNGEKVLGPAELFRVQGWSRSHILVKTDDIAQTLDAFKPVIEKYRGPYSLRGVRIVVDVDPQWLS